MTCPGPALQRVPERHQPFMGRASRQRPVRRAVRVKTVQRVPRPLSQAQAGALLEQLRSKRDRAIVLLMLQGGLRPGEVLGLHLEDIAYGRRVVVRHRDDHPKGARSKSRYERVVDLHEPETLAMLSAYVMEERPADAGSPLVFLVGGRGRRRLEALSYDGLVKMFTRATTRAGIRAPWVTPHACRHTHATAVRPRASTTRSSSPTAATPPASPWKSTPAWPSPTPSGATTTSSATSPSDHRDHARLGLVTRFLPACLP